MGLPGTPSLRSKHADAIRSMINPSKQDDDIDEVGLPPEPQWKVLVYDQFGADILSPLISVSELRSLGVTLYLQLHSTREHIPDTTVVYFVLPTKKNIDRICNDLSEDLYDKCQLNFLSCVSSELLEQLAMAALSSSTSTTIERVFDMYSNFISIEDDFFIMQQHHREQVSYLALNGPASDAEMMQSVESIVSALFCVVVSMGTVPIIRCSRDHAAQMIAEQLDKKLRAHLKLPRNNLFKDGMSVTGSFQRPLLAIVDRHVDISTMLHHTWTYQALAHDLLEYKLNRVGYDDTDTKGETVTVKRKTFDLDSRVDRFWAANRGKPFPHVAEAVEQELADCKRKEEQIRGAGGGAGGGADGGGAEGGGPITLTDNTSKIRDAVSSLPQLLEQKRQLTAHMSLLVAVMDKIKARKLDDYYGLEEEMMSETQPSQRLVDVASAGGSPADQLRLCTIAVLVGSGAGLKESDITAYRGVTTGCEEMLTKKGCDTAPLKYARELVKQRSRKSNRLAAGSQQKESWMGNLVDSGVGLGGNWWKQGVKRLLPSSSVGVLTQIVEALMEFKSTDLTKDYLYFDPKQLRSVS